MMEPKMKEEQQRSKKEMEVRMSPQEPKKLQEKLWALAAQETGAKRDLTALTSAPAEPGCSHRDSACRRALKTQFPRHPPGG